MSERPTLFLLDGHAITYRQYYVVARTPQLSHLTSRTGEPTGTVHRFTSVLLDILEKDHPEYLAATFDDGLSGREDYYPPYKAHRADPPADFEPQLQRVHDLVKAFNIPLFTMHGFEADDIIGTLSRQAEEQNVNIHIITGDKDILQLLSPNVTVRIPRFGEADVVWTEAHFQQEYGFPPPRLVDYKALVGDTSDNIPGVAGIGDKTAKQLLQQYGTLDGIYQNLQLLSKGVREKLIAGRDNAYLSYRLARIMRDLPVTLDLERCISHDFDLPTVEAIFDELSFRSHQDRLYRIVQAESTPRFEETTTKTEASDVVHTIIVDDEEKLEGLIQVLNAAQHIAFDTETTSVDQMQAELVGISLSVDGSIGYYIPVGHISEGAGTMFATPAPNQLAKERVIEALHGPLTNPAIPKYGHNASYDLVVLRRAGIDVQPITFDTMVAEWITDPVSKDLGLKNLAYKRLNVRMTEIDTLLKSKKRKTMAEVPVEEAAPYAAADAAMTMQLAMDTPPLPLATPQSLRQEIVDKGLQSLFDTLEMPLVPVIASMEQNGVMLDLPYLAQLSEKLTTMMESLEQRIYEMAGGPFKIGSTKQLNEVLFDKLKLSVAGLRKTAQGYSTDVNTLDALYDKHPVIPVILEHRELSKLKSTYIDALPSLVNPHTGRVHTSYNQTGTATGRVSSNSPNLQNIPNKTELGRDVRRAFIAPPGHVLLSVDYSQIELRLMAHISQDEGIISAFQRGEDIHRATAAAVYNIPAEEVTSPQRSFAKRVNFGILYGMGAHRLARDSELTYAEADSFVKTYRARFPLVDAYIENTKQMARDKGYVETLMRRRRNFPAMQNPRTNRMIMQAEERAAINAPIQGTAADILKLALLRLHAFLEEQYPMVKMILQVHDELVFEVPSDIVLPLARQIVQIMEDANPIAPQPLTVPLAANAQYGPNWNDMTPVPMD